VRDPDIRYRRWLRLYPTSYRSVRGQEILGTLLESSDEKGPTLRDFLHLAGHAVRVRLTLLRNRPPRGPLPQPARIVSWILTIFAAMDLITGLFLSHGGPKNPGPDVQEIIGGCILMGLGILLWARRPALYLLVVAVLMLNVVSAVLQADEPVFGLVLAAPQLVLALVLLAGWNRFKRATAAPTLPPSRRAPTA
jgi:hypothetical protein